MKIAIINRHPEDVLGGSELQCHNIADGLTNRSHEVRYYAIAGTPGKEYIANYPVVPVEKTGEQLTQLITKWHPDIIYWRMNKYGFYNTVHKLKDTNIPIVFAISNPADTRMISHTENIKHGPRSIIRASKQILKGVYNYRGFKYVDLVTSLNSDFIGLAPVKNQKFVPDSVVTDEIGFVWPRKFVTWVASIKAIKRPELFVKAAEHLRHLDIDFLMVGEIQSNDYDWIREINSDNFHYLGAKSIEEVNGILRASDLLIHTCLPEGFGNNFIQAWLMETPTISYEFDPAGLIHKEGLGEVAGNDFEKFISIIEKFILDSKLRNETGHRALQYSKNTFSIEKTIDSIEDAFTSLLYNK